MLVLVGLPMKEWNQGGTKLSEGQLFTFRDRQDSCLPSAEKSCHSLHLWDSSFLIGQAKSCFSILANQRAQKHLATFPLFYAHLYFSCTEPLAE